MISCLSYLPQCFFSGVICDKNGLPSKPWRRVSDFFFFLNLTDMWLPWLHLEVPECYCLTWILSIICINCYILLAPHSCGRRLWNTRHSTPWFQPVPNKKLRAHPKPHQHHGNCVRKSFFPWKVHSFVIYISQFYSSNIPICAVQMFWWTWAVQNSVMSW